MNAPTTLFATAVSFFLLTTVPVASFVVRRAQRTAKQPRVEELLARLATVDRHGVALVAAEFADRSTTAESEGLESWQLWELIGGIAGVEALAANCEVLIDLACHVQQWYPEALPVAEQLRLNAREIQWHLERLRGAESRGHLEIVFPDYAQRAVMIYHGMTQHVVALYEVSQVPGSGQIAAAL